MKPRTRFKLTLMVLALVATLAWGCAAAGPAPTPAGARNVIVFINDGMHLAHEVAASRYLYGQDFGLSWHKLPYRAYCTTWNVTAYNNYAAEQGQKAYSAMEFNPLIGYRPQSGGDAPLAFASPAEQRYFLPPGKPYATDSASAATAISTGVKTPAGNLAWLADASSGGRLTTIADRLRDQHGKAIGVVSTVPFNHATPAAFVAHNPSRRNYAAIAEEILTETRPEVVIGGGHPDWNASYGVTAAMIANAKATYTVVERTQGVDGNTALATAAANATMLLGLFGGKGGNFEYAAISDTPGSPAVRRGNPENPDLATAATAALEVLSKDPDGFFLMVEQGDIDWANHDNDFKNMIGSMADAERAVLAIMAWVDRPGDAVDWDNTMLIVTSDHANSYLRLHATLGRGELPSQVAGGAANRYGETTFGYPDGQVSYGSKHHTNELVTLYALGAGRDLFKNYEGKWYPGTRILDNTNIYDVMKAATGVK